MMTTRLVTALAIATGVGLGTAQGEGDQPPDGALKAAVKQVWQSQHKALDAHDIEGVMATFANSDDIMLMGTGPGEHWVGREEIKDAYAHFMENFDAHSMEVQCGEGAGTSRGDVVWLTGVCQFSDQQGDQTRQYQMNLSAVLVKQGDHLRFHTAHFSQLMGCDGSQSQDTSKQ
jgi:uncharacterized protein (TIGR02246 family)